MDNDRIQSVLVNLGEMTRYASRVVFLQTRSDRQSALVQGVAASGFLVAESVGAAISLCAQHDFPVVVIEYSPEGKDLFQQCLSELGRGLSRGARLLVVDCHADQGRGVDRYTSRMSGGWRFRSSEPMIHRFATEAGFEVVRTRPVREIVRREHSPIALSKEFFRHLSSLVQRPHVRIVVLRPRRALDSWPSLSIIIPARNERGTVEPLLRALPSFGGAKVEAIFVEGHSSDHTWEAIQSAIESYSGPVVVRAFKQSGSGKSDAVRLGFEKAQGELLVILDADSTVDPGQLVDFYEAYRSGQGDFLNGNRFQFSMERGAMRPLNKLGNIFFSRVVSLVLDCALGDTLCGTKLLRRADYERMKRWRHDFGDFDPFGDFELIFPAAVLGLGIRDVPVHYKARVYGETNIHRFTHGLQLLWMVLVGLWRIKLGMRSHKR